MPSDSDTEVEELLPGNAEEDEEELLDDTVTVGVLQNPSLWSAYDAEEIVARCANATARPANGTTPKPSPRTWSRC